MTADTDAQADLPADPAADETEQRRRLAYRLRRLDRLADLMDGQFQLPVVRYRVGLDPILGLVPGGGDWVAWVASAYILWGAARIGAPTHLLVVMAGNVAVDLLGGYVPVAGDVFDVAFKCNRRNVDLLLEHFDFQRPDEGSRSLPGRLPDDASGRWRLYLLAAALLVGLFVLALAPLALLWWLFS